MLGLVLVATGLLPASGLARPSARAADRTLDRDLGQLVAMSGGPPGVVAVIQRGGQWKLHRAGVRKLGTRQRITAFDRMRLASTAKAFSGAVALTLVSRGVLSLNDTIAKWLPQLPASWRKVTLREALNHTSGLPDFSGSNRFREFVGRHPHAQRTPLQLLAYVKRKPLEFRPGSRFEYSNSDNIVVALMAQRATGRSYKALLSSLVYSRLGLRHTSLPSGFRITAPFLHGYQLDPPAAPEDVSTRFSGALSWASGGLVSTPSDLNRFIRGYVGRRMFGRKVQRQQLKLVRGHSEPIGPGANMAGLAIFRYRTRCGTVYGHTGNTAGYTQFAAATLNGRRSVTVSASEQLTQNLTGQQLNAFRALRHAEADAVCAALASH